MASTIDKRVTGRMDGEFVVFLIGMRINRWWKFWRWLRVAGAGSDEEFGRFYDGAVERLLAGLAP